MSIPKAYTSSSASSDAFDSPRSTKEAIGDVVPDFLKTKAEKITDLEDIHFQNNDFTKFLSSLSAEQSTDEPVILKDLDNLLSSKKPVTPAAKNPQDVSKSSSVHLSFIHNFFKILVIVLIGMTCQRLYTAFCSSNIISVIEAPQVSTFMEQQRNYQREEGAQSSIVKEILQAPKAFGEKLFKILTTSIRLGGKVMAAGETPQPQADNNTALTPAPASSSPFSKKKDREIPTLEFDPLSIDSIKEVETLTKIAKEQKALQKEREEIKIQKRNMEVMKKELEIKIVEMKALKESIKSSLAEVNKQHKLKLDKFIKIIEGMKIKNAALVFDKLETNVIKELLPQMNPKKISSILDQMPPSKAKDMLVMTVAENNPYVKPTK